MPKLGLFSGEEIVRIMKKAGFLPARQKGSHMIMQKRIASSTITVPVPMHKTVKIGTLQSILKRKRERQSNNWRAAWNRVGKRFRLPKEDLEHAKKTDLNPYHLLRNNSVTAESARAYIYYDRMPDEIQYDSWTDLVIDIEIAWLE